jgi:gamma-glutamyl:cysteine ligase YbdK (ATP-grasp superfamily)
MGQNLDRDTFTPADHDAFRKRIIEQLDALKPIVSQADFSAGPASIGAELELYIIDKTHQPAAQNTALLNMMQHPLLTEELNQFNLEFNLSPVEARGTPFSNMTEELTPVLEQLRHKASSLECKIATIGILPTLSSAHLHRDFMTDLPRYRALTNELSALKGEPFLVDINGADSLKMRCDEVTLEGANTSFQVHLKVPADRFAALYNAAQITTPLVLALAGNSPTFLGQRLWHETRIALFKQSIDNRIPALTKWRQPARVSFGHGWVREGAWELFAENVALYRPLMPYVSPINKPFAELSLHHGTVWSWNRAVFEPNHGGHLRIEYRALPAGPTTLDMMANAALAIGLTQALSHDIDDALAKLPFQYAEYNFYRAAQSGLSTNILWPQAQQHGLRESAITDVIAGLLNKAADGLAELSVDSAEINRLMSVVEQRLATQQTGARWQLARLDKYAVKHSKDKAMSFMLRDYMENSEQGNGVASWAI